MSSIAERIPPHNIDAEQALLGAILISENLIYDVVDLVCPDDFYRNDHRMIFESMAELFGKNSPINIITVSDNLSNKGLLDKVGGTQYLAMIADEVPISANAVSYAGIIAEKSVQRRIITSAQNIAKAAYEPGGEAGSLVEYAEKEIFEIAQRKSKKSYAPISDVLADVYTALESLSGSKGVPGVPTGFVDLDKHLSGLRNSDLILVAARPGMGKTAWMLNIAQYAAVKKKIPVAVFNLEMSKEQVATRILSGESNVSNEKLRSGELADSDWADLAEAVSNLSDAPIYIDDTVDVSISSIRAKCRKLKLEKDIKLVIIDYLQLMQGSRKGGDGNRVQEVAEISRALKIMARELNVPVVVGSQLSRAVESRPDKRPMLSDLRESGSIEQDADIVMFLYRDYYYNKENPQFKNVAEVIIAKHRNGSTGKVELFFDEEHIRFKNMAHHQ
ncbi:MAG: replicative DNA helicase [Clostridia bacterium]|nr:replicative DNA helicase [Clostridia bacterium]